MLSRKFLLRTLVPALSIAVVFSSLSYAVTPDRISGALNGQSVALPGNVHPYALPKFDQGPVSPALHLGTMTLVTAPTAGQLKALKRLLAEQQDPKSPNYHKWLTPEEWADRFGLSPTDLQKITSWLQAQGFSGVQAARGRNWVSFTGTAAQAQSAFGTEIHRYSVNGKVHYANPTSPQIPAAVAGVVTGIRGLHDFLPRPMGVRRTRPYYNSSRSGDLIAPGDVATMYDINALYTAGIDGTGQKLAVMGQTDIHLADLNDFRTGFGLSPTSITCTTNSSDVITACNDAHLRYVLDGTDPGLSTSGDLSEADLDLEWSGAVAKNAQIIYVNSTDVFTSFYYAIDNNLAPVISLSYGLCEFFDNFVLDPTNGQPAADELELMKANSQGITFVNSSGDSGAAECDNPLTSGPSNLAQNGIAVGYPASSPEVTGVGGTSISLANLQGTTYWGTTNGADGGTAKSYIPELAWNDDAEFAQFCAANPNSFCTGHGITNAQTAQAAIGISQTGGGASNCAKQTTDFSACVSGFPMPSWQTVSISGQTTRLSPDVSFLATPNFPGYIFCTNVTEFPNDGTTGSTCAPGGAAGITAALALNTPPIIGGTSVSAPVFAGMVALLNQYLSSPGLGNVNPMLYQLAAATPSNGAFNRVNTGTNQVYCTAGTPGAPQPAALDCPNTGILGFDASVADATTGYNMVTGLGSVDANNLALAWAASLQSFTASASALNPASVIAGNSATSTITITPVNGFNGTVALSCSGAPTGVTCGFNPATVTGGSGTTTLTVSTAASMAPVANASFSVIGTSGGLSTTTSVSLTVTATNQSFTLTANPATYTVAQGNPTDATINLTGTNGFNTPLTYACVEPATLTESTCTGPTGATANTTVSFHITTTHSTAELHRPFERNSRLFYAILMPGLLGILFVAGSRKRSRRGMRMLGLILVLAASTLWMGSCGGSSNSTQHNPGTPTGTYTITVNATTGGNTPVTGSTTFTLTVQ